jgi:hypothetical protein
LESLLEIDHCRWGCYGCGGSDWDNIVSSIVEFLWPRFAPMQKVLNNATLEMHRGCWSLKRRSSAEEICFCFQRRSVVFCWNWMDFLCRVSPQANVHDCAFFFHEAHPTDVCPGHATEKQSEYCDPTRNLLGVIV